MLTGQSKPLKLPLGVKNNTIGNKKLTFPAAFTKDNEYVVAGVRDNIYIWETSYGLFIKTLDAHYGRINNMLTSSSELKNLVLSGSMDKTIKVWNIQNILEENFPLDHLDKQIEMLHVSIEAQIAIAQSRTQMALISLKTGRILHFLCHSPHGAIFNCSALSVSGIYAASSESNRLVVWNVQERVSIHGNTSVSSQVRTTIMQLKFHQQGSLLLCSYFDPSKRIVRLENQIVESSNVTYTLEYGVKEESGYREFVISSDEFYLVFFRGDKKSDMLAVYFAFEGTLIHNVKLTYTGYLETFRFLVPMNANPHLIALIDSEKGTVKVN